MKPKVVFDCMVFLQAIARAEGPAGVCLRAAENGVIELWISTDVLEELRAVLTRPQLRRKFPALTAELVQDFLMRVKEFSQELSNVPKSFELRRDPKDEKYIDLAVAVEASFLVSRDKDLLDLMNDAHPDSRDFRARFPHLRILDPLAFLRNILPESSAEGA